MIWKGEVIVSPVNGFLKLLLKVVHPVHIYQRPTDLLLHHLPHLSVLAAHHAASRTGHGTLPFCRDTLILRSVPQHVTL